MQLESKTFAEKAKMIHLAQIKRHENEELFTNLKEYVSRQEVLLAKVKENDQLIKSGEKELEDLIAANYAIIIKKVHQYTDNSNMRLRFLKEGRKRIREMLTNYDYSNIQHFNDDLQGVFADFLVYMEGSSI